MIHSLESCQPTGSSLADLFFLIVYFFTFKERVREGERKGEKQQCARDNMNRLPLSPAPKWGPGPRTTHFQFTGQHSVHRATPARGDRVFVTMILMVVLLASVSSRLYYNVPVCLMVS